MLEVLPATTALTLAAPSQALTQAAGKSTGRQERREVEELDAHLTKSTKLMICR